MEHGIHIPEAQIGFQLIEGEGTVYLDDFSVAWIEEIPEYDDATDGLVELDGNWALRMGNGEAPVIYDIPDIPAGKYEYSFSVKNESKTEAAKFTFCGETIEVAPGSEWVQKKGVLSSTEAITKLTFQRISGTFYLDNVKLDEYEEEEEHTCNFNQEVVDAKYLKTPATCTSPAVYYKSCTCGEKGTGTFEYGTAKGHTYQNKVDAKYLKTPATCTSAAVYYTSCKECGVKGTTTFTSGTAKGHTKVTDKAVAATCTKQD